MLLVRARALLWVSALLASLVAMPVVAQDDQASDFTPAQEDAIRNWFATTSWRTPRS